MFTFLISVDYLAAASLSLLLLPSPSRPSGCRPSFTDNPKAQPLFAQHSLLFTSLAGVTFFHFTFSAIRPFHIKALPNPSRAIAFCGSRQHHTEPQAKQINMAHTHQLHHRHPDKSKK